MGFGVALVPFHANFPQIKFCFSGLGIIYRTKPVIFYLRFLDPFHLILSFSISSSMKVTLSLDTSTCKDMLERTVISYDL